MPYPYAIKHNPELFTTSASRQCPANDLPLGTTAKGPFASALAADTLPPFSFVTPNLCNDMHDCSVGNRRHLARPLACPHRDQPGVPRRAHRRVHHLGRG